MVASLPTPDDGPADALPTDPPRVWLVLGEKIGDNNQVDVIADALPWPLVRKILRFRPPYDREKPPFAVSIDHVDRVRSDRLEPPWPDLILTSGLGGNYPANIIVGQVTSVRSLEFELFQEAEVRSLNDFERLEFVMVITSFEPVDLSIFEPAEEEEAP